MRSITEGAQLEGISEAECDRLKVEKKNEKSKDQIMKAHS